MLELRANHLTVIPHSVFCNAALASGLLAPEQLEQLVEAACAELEGERPTEEQIAQQAVALGVLNRWQAAQLRLGRTKFTLGEYQILDSIGQGGMGHVFKAEHSMLGRLEAIKVLPISKTTPDSIANFRHEIRAQAQLDHPNLVRLSYAGQDGAAYFFVTEFVPGVDLRRLVRKNGRLTMFEAATIIAQAAQGLQHAHENGLVHRDVKPGNLLVTPTGHTKVADLGLAGYLHDDDGDDPRAGKIVGTADYLAPETIRTPGEVSPASDVYALGCTLYYAVTGKVPFPAGTTRDKLRRQCDEMPLNPQRINAELDDSFVEVLADMMEKDRAKRIQTAEEVIHRLAPWTLASAPISVYDGPLPPDAPSGSQSGLSGVSNSAGWLPSCTPPPRQSAGQLARSTPAGVAPLHETLPLEDDGASQGVPWDAMRQRVAQWGSNWAARLRQIELPPDLLSRMLVPLLLGVALLITAAVLFAVLSGQ